jgi:BirA family biotin operon repressor/biotin-[acetyl-CoA-carboxylase] ligase
MNRNSLVTSALALSIVGCLYEEGIEAFVKWPNDIVLKEPIKGKLAGILSEYIPGNPEKIVIGFGININWPAKKIKGLEEAVSLKMIGKNFNKWDLLIGVLKNFEKKLQILAEPNGQDILRQEHIAKSETLGTMIQVEMQKNEIRGLATDITEEGFLLVDDGATVTEITSGDVRKLRNQ